MNITVSNVIFLGLLLFSQHEGVKTFLQRWTLKMVPSWFFLLSKHYYFLLISLEEFQMCFCCILQLVHNLQNNWLLIKMWKISVVSSGCLVNTLLKVQNANVLESMLNIIMAYLVSSPHWKLIVWIKILPHWKYVWAVSLSFFTCVRD